MKGLVVVLHVLNTLVGLTLVWSVFVHLNYTYTHADLPDDNVRFYKHNDPANLTEGHSGRYGLYWWITWSHALRWLGVYAVTVSVLASAYSNTSLNLLTLLVVGVLAFSDAAKFLWMVLLWTGENCEDHQFCRNHGARRDPGGNEIGDDPRQQNGAYSFDVFYTMSIAIAWFLYMIFVLARLRGAFEERRRAEDEVAARLPPEPGSPADVAARFAAKSRPPAGHAIASSVVSLVLVVALIVYQPWVHQNLTFTQGATADAVLPPDQQFNLPDDAIPYFVHDVPGDPTEGASGRGGAYWWLFASDALIGLVPLAVLGNLVDKKCDRRGFTKLAQAFLAALSLWTLVKVFWLALLALPPLCERFQFCRAFGARRDAGGAEIGANASNMNFVYALAVWFQVGFLVLLMVLLVLVSTLPDAWMRAAVVRRMKPASKQVKAHVQTAATALHQRARSAIAGVGAGDKAQAQRASAKGYRRQ